MTDAKSSFGTLLKVGDGGGPEVFTTIAEVRDLDGPKLSLAREEATHHTSPGGFDEHVPTILSGGDITFEINWDPADPTHSGGAGLVKDMKDKTLRNYQIVRTDTAATTWSASAHVTGFEPKAPVKGIMGASVTLGISGEPDLP